MNQIDSITINTFSYDDDTADYVIVCSEHPKYSDEEIELYLTFQRASKEEVVACLTREQAKCIIKSLQLMLETSKSTELNE